MAPKADEVLKALRPGGKPPPRRTVAGAPTCEITVRLKVVTPILGGGPKLRQLDDVDVIRVPTVRGHLRFWWRALYGHQYATSQKLYEAESALWGRPAEGNGGRSYVEVQIDVDRSTVPASNPGPVSMGSIDGYALWPAREPHADRRPPGTEFTLRIISPREHEAVLRSTIRAWILFGGYGSRTRRGLGSLTVEGDEKERKTWLPSLITDGTEKPDELRTLFSGHLFGMSHFKRKILTPERGRIDRELPQFSNALLHVDLAASTNEKPGVDGTKAWTTALGWLKSFRQDEATGARRKGRGKPGQSNWPEPDKIRRHYGDHFEHRAREEYTSAMAWPRAGFGLPIVWEIRGRNEPGKYTLRWRSANGEHDRLASPLILKGLPLANGNFLPCALWLDRGLPDGALVGLEEEAKVAEGGKQVKIRRVKPGTEAPFHRTVTGPTDHPLLAPKDTPLFAPLSGKATLRAAFCDWLVSKKLAQRIAP
jgi:CRISPR-associated protein Cmr1